MLMGHIATGVERKWLLTVFVSIFLVVSIAVVAPEIGLCAEKTYSGNFESLIRLLEQKGIITQNEAEELIQRLQTPADEETMEPDKFPESEVLKQELNETQERLEKSVDQLLQRDRLTERKLEELNAKVKDDIASKQYKSSWAQRINLNGDVRLRYQSEMFDEENTTVEDPDDRSKDVNTTVDRDRYRYRARIGLRANLIDPRDINVGKVDVGLRVATGNSSDPISTNTTMGDAFNKDSFVLDRAYLTYRWKPIEEKWGRIPEFSVTAGRMPNPFFSTDLVWDNDLNFEGLAVNLTSDVLESNSWRCFFTAGAFPLEELELRASDKWLYGGQIGIEHKPFWGLNYKLALAYYQYENYQGEPLNDETEMLTVVDWDWSVPRFRQKRQFICTYQSVSWCCRGGSKIGPSIKIFRIQCHCKDRY